MKKLLTKSSLLFASTLILIACDSQENDTTADDEAVEETEETETDTNVAEAEEDDEEEVDDLLVEDGPLLNVGEYTIDDQQGHVELLNITDSPIEHEVADNVIMTIEDAKILDFKEIPRRGLADLEYHYGFENEQEYGLQVTYSISNENDYAIENSVIDEIVLSNGEQINRHSFNDSESHSLRPNARTSNSLAFFRIDDPEIEGFTVYPNLSDEDWYSLDNISSFEVTFN